MLKLGHYLGPSIDVGPAMTMKILTENGQVLHRSTYRPLTPDELLDRDGSDAQEQFMARVHERLGSCVLPRELEDLGLEDTPQYDPYEDETQNEQMLLQLAEELEPTPEAGDLYIGAEILLPRGDQMARGHVVARIRDANGNMMGRYHTNPILDMRKYQVEFAGGEVTELTANIIAESMYAQCDLEENEYLLLDVLVDYFKDNKAISLSNQQSTVQGRPVTCKSSAD